MTCGVQCQYRAANTHALRCLECLQGVTTGRVLSVAAERGSTGIMELLLGKGADVNGRNSLVSLPS